MIRDHLAISASDEQAKAPAQLHAVQRIQYYAVGLSSPPSSDAFGCSLTDSPVGQLAWILEVLGLDGATYPETCSLSRELLDNVISLAHPPVVGAIHWESFGAAPARP
jgi:hypothetical protein